MPLLFFVGGVVDIKAQQHEQDGDNNNISLATRVRTSMRFPLHQATTQAMHNGMYTTLEGLSTRSVIKMS